MAVIFDSGIGKQANAGQVVLLQPTVGAGSLLQVEEWGGFTLFKAIFTTINIAEATNHQFQHMLGNRVYLNAFGDRIGQLTLAGMAFFDNCGSRQQANQAGALVNGRNQRIGISHVIEYYRRNKLTNRAAPIKITIDPVTAYEGYLNRFQGQMFGDQHTASRLYQFNLQFAILPPELTGQEQKK